MHVFETHPAYLNPTAQLFRILGHFDVAPHILQNALPKVCNLKVKTSFLPLSACNMIARKVLAFQVKFRLKKLFH